MSKSDRYRGLRPNPQALGVVPLAAGEASKPVRVRASVEVHEWLKGMNAAQVGEVLTRAYRDAQQGHRKAVKVLPNAAEGPSTPANAQADKSVRGIEEGARLKLGVIPPDLKPHHAPIVQALQAGATLQQVDGLWKLVGAGQARTLKPMTVELLLRIGVLTH
jgi:hypothetical protein